MTEQRPEPYDLFVSYTRADRVWVWGFLLPALGLTAGRVITPADFRPGAPVVDEFERAVSGSRFTLLVLTPAYLADEWSTFGEQLSSHASVAERRDRLVPLLLEPCALPLRVDFRVRLDCTDKANWEGEAARLRDLLDRPEPARERIACPYPGMKPFDEEGVDRFFGRDRERRELLERLHVHPFLAIIGPSGSGKSSLVYAGLIPELRKSSLFGPGDWLVKTVRPGEAPLARLWTILGGDPVDPTATVEGLLAAQAEGRMLLLVVDQFEELFTRARVEHPEELAPFHEALRGLARTSGCYVVLTARADFYPDLMGCPLWDEIRDHRLEVLPLDEKGLREAIVRPAAGAGVYLETELVERLLSDAAGEPGILPLLQEALVLLWDRMERRFLPAKAYEDLGRGGRTGLQVAMERRADAALAGLKDPAQEAIARRIFLRLVQFGEGRADTRRQQPVSALGDAGDPLFQATLQHLASRENRLLTFGGAEEGEQRWVDLAHEALIEGWPTLHEWVGKRREAELTRRRLESKAQDWVRLKEQGGGLLDEVELREALDWLDSPDSEELGGASDTLLALVQASRTAIEEAEREKEAARQRELKLERQRTEEKAKEARRLRWLVVGLAVVFLVATGAAFLAVRERDRAEQQSYEARLALSGQLAVQAQAVLERQPQLSLLLAVEALNVMRRTRERYIPAAEQILRQTLARLGGRVLDASEKGVNVAAFSPDNRWLVAGHDLDKTVYLWDLAGPGPAAAPILLTGHESDVSAVGISPDSHWLVTGSRDSTIRLWDLSVADPSADPKVLIGHNGTINVVTVSPDDHWLVTGSSDNTARLWDLTDPDPNSEPIVLRGHEVGKSGSFCTGRGCVAGLARAVISPDGRWLATTSNEDNAARLWDLTSADPAADPMILTGHQSQIESVAISPDNHWLVTGGQDGTVRLWDLAATDPASNSIVLTGHSDAVETVAVSPDSRWLVTASPDIYGHETFLWALTTEPPYAERVISLAYAVNVDTTAFSSDSEWLAIAGPDSTVGLWDLRAPRADPITLGGHEVPVRAMAISADNHWLVTGSGDGTARIWDLSTNNPGQKPIVLCGHEGGIGVVTISPDSHWLVTGRGGEAARLWDLTAVSSLGYPTVEPLVLEEQRMEAISPDDHWLITQGPDYAVRLWDLTTQDLMANPIVLSHEARLNAIAVSPNGHWLATNTGYPLGGDRGSEVAQLWDLTAQDPSAAPVVLRGHQGGIFEMAISPDSHWLATTAWDNTARLWDLTADDPSIGSLVLRGHEDPILDIAFSLDSKWLVTGSTDPWISSNGDTRLWDLEDPPANPLALRHEHSILPFAISSNDRWLVTMGGGMRTVHLWDLTARDLEVEPILLRERSDYSGIAVSRDHRWLAVADEDRTIRVWDLNAPDPTAAPLILHSADTVVSNIDFGPDNHWLVTRGPWATTGRLWDLTAQDPAATPIFLADIGSNVGSSYAEAIFLDDHWLLTTGGGTHVRLWDLTAPDPGASSVALPDPASGLLDRTGISSDGHWLVTSDYDTHLWTLRPDELIDHACRLAGRNLTHDEWTLYFPGQTYRKTCSNLPIHPSLISVGRDLAWAGDVERAIAQFEEVLARDPDLDLDPDAEARQTAAESLIQQGGTHLFNRDREEAFETFQEALALLDPILEEGAEARLLAAEALAEQASILVYQEDLEGASDRFHRALVLLDPLIDQRVEARWLAARANIDYGEALVRKGEVAAAIAAYAEAQTVAPHLEISAVSWNRLCWFGSLWGHAAEVLQACERAVEFSEGNPLMRDSRGLAGALMGNYEGAMEDFGSYAQWLWTTGQYGQEYLERKAWIAALGAGRNPFDEATLEDLRNR